MSQVDRKIDMDGIDIDRYRYRHRYRHRFMTLVYKSLYTVCVSILKISPSATAPVAGGRGTLFTLNVCSSLLLSPPHPTPELESQGRVSGENSRYKWTGCLMCQISRKQ